MRLYLDTEFNGFAGELISLALVPESDDDDSWYEVLQVPASPTQFVRQHVLPALRLRPIGQESFMSALHGYLSQLPKDVEIIADWPEDIAQFCACLCKEGGWQLQFWPKLTLINSGKFTPKVPHNALSDAIALKNWHLANQG